MGHSHFNNFFVFSHLTLECIFVRLKLHQELLLLVDLTDLLIEQRVVLGIWIHAQSTCAYKRILRIADIKIIRSILVATGLRLQLLRQH